MFSSTGCLRCSGSKAPLRNYCCCCYTHITSASNIKVRHLRHRSAQILQAGIDGRYITAGIGIAHEAMIAHQYKITRGLRQTVLASIARLMPWRIYPKQTWAYRWPHKKTQFESGTILPCKREVTFGPTGIV